MIEVAHLVLDFRPSIRIHAEKAIRSTVATEVAGNSGITFCTTTVTTFEVAELEVESPSQIALNWYVPAEEKAMSRVYTPLAIVSNVCWNMKPEPSFDH